MSEDKQYDFYVAGPFFDPEQTASMERLEKILEDHGKVLFENLTPMDRVNLMIAQAVELVFVGPDDVAKYLETGEHTEVDYIQF